MATYTNRQRRNNLVREMCHRLVREQMPKTYALLRAKAEKVYRDQRPDLTAEDRAECARSTER